jgi:Protein of unknown function (DUF3223)
MILEVQTDTGELHTFPTKKRAIEHVRGILHKYNPGDRVATSDEALLRALLLRHPDAPEKIGTGISHFSVSKDIFGTQHFNVHRLDGTAVDFSFYACIRAERRMSDGPKL